MDEPERVIGRYQLFEEIAAGGMATVHFGRLVGPVGFSRTVAIKRLHPEYARDTAFVTMLVDEARLAARINHPNVVTTLDVVATDGELFVVMEYVQGVSMAGLIYDAGARGDAMPVKIVASIIQGALLGLHAAHEATDESGKNLGIVHRDMSASNILVGADGMARVIDFGLAKAAGRAHLSRVDTIKGTPGYMAPEQLRKQPVTRAADIAHTSVVLWEALCGKRMFTGETVHAFIAHALFGEVETPSSINPALAPFDEVVMKGLQREPGDRWVTARDMALALEDCVGVASTAQVSAWLEKVAGGVLSKRAEAVARVEHGVDVSVTEVRARVMNDLALDPLTEWGAEPSSGSGRWPAEQTSGAGRWDAELSDEDTELSLLRLETVPDPVRSVPPPNEGSIEEMGSSVFSFDRPAIAAPKRRSLWKGYAALSALVVAFAAGGTFAWLRLGRSQPTAPAASTDTSEKPPEPAPVAPKESAEPSAALPEPAPTTDPVVEVETETDTDTATPSNPTGGWVAPRYPYRYPKPGKPVGKGDKPWETDKSDRFGRDTP